MIKYSKLAPAVQERRRAGVLEVKHRKKDGRSGEDEDEHTARHKVQGKVQGKRATVIDTRLSSMPLDKTANTR